MAVVGPTATGKSHLAIALAHAVGGEIINCDSTAVYRGFDIGTDKVPERDRQGVPHHLIDIVEPTDVYTAARFAADAAAVIRDVHARGHVPIVVGGTGLYFRALVRGLFPGPAADEALRARLTRVAERRGDARLHRLLVSVDPEAAARIAAADRKKVVRAIEVFRATGIPLTRHFEATRSPIDDCAVHAAALRVSPEATLQRVAARVVQQFERGIVDEVRGLLARGVPSTARPFGGLVYRQVLDLLAGAATDAETRQDIVTANRQYARRQLIWFRKEPNLRWFDGPGESPDVVERVTAWCRAALHDDADRP